MQYSADQLVRLAKRDNNSVRPYLFVNPLQGKHIPTPPEETVGMCREAARLVNEAYPDDRLYVIGFAETATGIAALISSFLRNILYYQNTTREPDGGECILFSEVHSHATDQRLRTAGIEDALKNTDRIVFIDDEVTTGNTIFSLIRILQSRYHADHMKFTILSLLNSMSDKRFSEVRGLGTDCLFLCRIPFEYRKDSITGISFDPRLHLSVPETDGSGCRYPEETVPCSVNARNLTLFSEYEKAAGYFAEEIRERLLKDGGRLRSVLVLGTEEFMYPAFKVGEMIRQQGYADEVLIHATTRSPIIASGREGYPLHCRVQIRSPYDPLRTTYIYNLRKYDRVFILTDAEGKAAGLGDLCSALKSKGNKDITVVRWQTGRREKETV